MQNCLAENHTEVQNNSISVVMQKYGAKYYIIYIRIYMILNIALYLAGLYEKNKYNFKLLKIYRISIER